MTEQSWFSILIHNINDFQRNQHIVCALLRIKKWHISGHLRISSMAKLPRLREGGQRPEVERLVPAHQLALHLPRGTDGIGPPLEGGWTTCGLWQQLWTPVARRMVAGEQYGRLPLSGSWRKRERMVEAMRCNDCSCVLLALHIFCWIMSLKNNCCFHTVDIREPC